MASVRPMGEPPRYRELTLALPADLVDELDEHIVNRVHEGELSRGASLDRERGAQVAIALRSLLNHWPDLGPAYATPIAQAAERMGPHASGGAP